MVLLTKAQRAIYFAKRKISMFVICAMMTVGSVIPVFADTDSTSTGITGSTELLEGTGDVDVVKEGCKLVTKWGWIFCVVALYKYLKSQGDEKNNGIMKALLIGSIAIWVLSLNEGALLFQVINFVKYLGGVAAGQ